MVFPSPSSVARRTFDGAGVILTRPLGGLLDDAVQGFRGRLHAGGEDEAKADDEPTEDEEKAGEGEEEGKGRKAAPPSGMR